MKATFKNVRIRYENPAKAEAPGPDRPEPEERAEGRPHARPLVGVRISTPSGEICRRVGRKIRAKALYSCSRWFVVVRSRTVCVGITVGYYPSVFAPVRLEPPILLRQRCDPRNRRGLGNGVWVRTDARRAAAYASVNRGLTRLKRFSIAQLRRRIGCPISAAKDLRCGSRRAA